MITTTETGRIYRVTGDKVRIVNADLNAAVELTQQRAIGEGKHGVLVEHDSDAVQEGCGTGGRQRLGTTNFGRIRNQLRKER